jgi:molybdopterin-containing oxidoreductase family membrane subunit
MSTEHENSDQPGGAGGSEASEAKAYFREVTNTVCGTVEKPTPKFWYPMFGVASLMLGLLLWSLYTLFTDGVGVWGNNNTENWAWPIVNFVFWIGIGHAGTLISAILFLMRQKWRTSINRAAEAMTLFAVACAGLFPVIHTGRPWVAYWLLPLPNDMAMWPQFRSPLMWDVFAVSTYLTVSVLFWYMGLVPDMATMRDRARTRLKTIIYGVLALGWRGSARQWHRYERAYLIMAALSTPLVFSVHSVVSMDFATSQLPGWHTTIFPPYFVAGAIFSGFAMVLTLMIPCRYLFGWKNILKASHIESMCKILLATGMMVGFAYATEFFIAWYSGNLFEKFVFINRVAGPYAWAYWTMVSCNVIFPQLFWFKFFRTNMAAIFILCVLVNVGMWFERFVIIVTSQSRGFLPSTWNYFKPTLLDATTFIGSFGLFFFLFLLFVKFVPAIAIFEVKVASEHAHAGADHHE